MKKTDLFRLAVTNLRRRKVRTGLTTMGVVIGTAAVVTMVSMGVGLQKNLIEQISRIGELHELEVFPRYDLSSSPALGAALPPPVRPLDEAAIKELRAIEGVVAVMPNVQLHGAELNFGRYRTHVTLTGVDTADAEELKVEVDSGRHLRRGEELALVLGYQLPVQLIKPDRAAGKGRRLGGASPSASEESALQEGQLREPVAKDRPDMLQKTVFLNLVRPGADGREETKNSASGLWVWRQKQAGQETKRR